MRFGRRVRTVYRKELIDILRDRRTLIAMVVVPIVLYPLLTLGSLQVVSSQVETLKGEEIIIGLIRQEHGTELFDLLLGSDRAALAAERAKLDPDSEEAQALPESIKQVDYRLVDTRAHLEQAVRDRVVHVGLIFPADRLVDDPEYSNEVIILADHEELRSRQVAQQLMDLFARCAERRVEQRLEQVNLPAQFIHPFTIDTVDLSTPQSLLGEILPLILVLMTITGAIYPAIDLTAGERERGTLESLMVCPVPVLDLIVGKFMVVTTVALMGAALNLASMTATVYFGGFSKIIASGGEGVPVGRMLLILLSLVPFAVLMSAIMIAVCSYARTFKEAQNYVMPVILAVLVPGGLAALPTAQFEGSMLVMPVGNMVLLARELLLGAMVPFWKIALVLGATTLYAGAAVAVAANVFGRESVVFTDSASLKMTFSRRMIRPAPRASVTLTLLVTALLFPLWYFIQASSAPGPDEDATKLLGTSMALMPVCFVILPAAVLWYWKIDLRNTLSLRLPPVRHLIAAILLGLSMWVPAHELTVAQEGLFFSEEQLRQLEPLAQALTKLPVVTLFLYLAVIPALCEEFFFRGFLLGGLATGRRRWSAILITAVIFGAFHFVLFKFAVTTVLGVALGLLCWQARSLWPAVLAHLLHNGVQALTIARPGWNSFLGIKGGEELAHLPPHIWAIAGAMIIVGIALLWRRADEGQDPSS